MMIRAVLPLLCSLIFLNSSAQTTKAKQEKSKGTTLFSVNKKPVTAEEFTYLYKKNHQNPAEDFTKEKIEEYLTLYINFKLKVEEARRRGMDTTAAFRKEFNQYKEELRKPYLPGNNLTDSLVTMTYNRMKEEVRASHILLSVTPDSPPADTLRVYNKIIDLRKRALAGEDFARLAEQNSEDPSAKVNKGDLGYFTAMQMVYPFENAAFSTKVGEVSQPVRTRFGYHILKVYDRRPARGEVEVSHIMIRQGEDKSNEQAKALIFDIYEKLQGGVAWNELCAEFSEDPSSKENGGRLRPFGTGVMANVPEFERVAFELTKSGEYSDPVQTQYGWHIIRLERKIPLASLEELAPSLKSKVARDERSQISQRALQTKLRKDYGFTENPQVKTELFALADTTLRKAKWNPVPSKTLASQTVFTLDNKPVSATSFIAYARKNQRSNNQEPQRYLETLYNSFVDEQMTAVLEEHIVKQHPEYTYLLNEYYEGILLFEIMEKEVWNKASDDSVGQQRYFQQNNAKYQAVERAKATIYSTQNAALIEELKPLVNSTDTKPLQAFITENKIKVESGFFKKEDKVILSRVSWATGIHSAENNGMYYLAWIKELLPAGQMSFEEARPTLISDYQSHLEESWVKELRKKYPVKVYEKTKEKVIQQLQHK